MIVDTPVATPVTTPLDEPIVATDVVPLLQVPPEVALPRVVVRPMHTFGVPVIAGNAGSAFTVRDCCAVLVPPLQPPVIV